MLNQEISLNFSRTIVSNYMFFKTKVKGYIGKYQLQDWWKDCFSKEERDYIVEKYKPLTFGVEESPGSLLINGDPILNVSICSFLGGMANWFQSKTDIDYSIGCRFIEKSKFYESSLKDIFEKHFYFDGLIQFFYKFRDLKEGALELSIEACESQIDFAEASKNAFLIAYPDSVLVSHNGFDQLSIIELNRGNYQRCIDLCKLAMGQGWSGNWEFRIKKSMNKLGLK